MNSRVVAVHLHVSHEMLENPNWSPEGQVYLDSVLVDAATAELRRSYPDVIVTGNVSNTGNNDLDVDWGGVPHRAQQTISTEALLAMQNAPKKVRRLLADGLRETPDGTPIYVNCGVTFLPEEADPPSEVDCVITRLQKTFKERLVKRGWHDDGPNTVSLHFSYAEWERELDYLAGARYLDQNRAG